MLLEPGAKLLETGAEVRGSPFAQSVEERALGGGPRAQVNLKYHLDELFLMFWIGLTFELTGGRQRGRIGQSGCSARKC